MQISDNTKAILLLTAPLMFGKSTNEVKLLTLKEYHQFAIFLNSIKKQPADLLTPELDNILNTYGKLDNTRIHQLLNRGFLLSQVLDYWQSRNIWVISRADKTYPSNFKNRLKENAPAILYGCGNIDLLNMGGLAIVGSRNINDELIKYTINIASLSAQANQMIISGGAKGADLAAMQGALNAGGTVCGVLSDSLEKAALNAENRLPLQQNRLVLISACDPKSRFNVGNAMVRNKYIYALANAGLIINADLNKGGTWAGAIEQLEKYRQIPIYIRSTGQISDGLNTLANKGALPWKNPQFPQEFLDIFKVQPPQLEPDTVQHLFSENVIPILPKNEKSDVNISPDEELFLCAKKLILNSLDKPKNDKELAQLLNVSPAQIKKWLERLIDENIIIKTGRPVRYDLIENHNNFRLFQ